MTAVLDVLAEGLSPSNDQARQWARDELSGPNYQPREPGALERFANGLARWFGDRLGSLNDVGSNVPTVIAIVLGVLVLALVIYALVFVRRNPRSGPDTDIGPVLGGEPLSAKSFRARAEELLAAGDADGCVREAMRAVTRRAAERGVLTDAPSLTAHEVAIALGVPFPQYTDPLRTGATVFDAVVYGGRHATVGQARSILDLDDDLRSTRPAAAGSAVSSERFAVPR